MVFKEPYLRNISVKGLLCFVLIIASIGCSAQNLDNPPLIPSQPMVGITTTHTSVPSHFLPSPTITSNPTPTPIPSVNLMAVGDVMLARSVGSLIQTNGSKAPFFYMDDVLSSADLTLGNLECVISEHGEAEDKAYTFRAPPSSVESLVLAGFDLVTLANNHSLDYGTDAFKDMMDLLKSKEIAFAGAGLNANSARGPVILQRNGLRLAFLAYLDIPIWQYDYRTWAAGTNKPGVAWGYLVDIESDVQAATRIADVVIVLMHFGLEGELPPTQAQIATAHTAIDAGATLVIGSHPHLLQELEVYNGGLIAYSLGNFVFDGFTGRSNKSAILNIVLSTEGVEEYRLIPIEILDDGLPRLVEN